MASVETTEAPRRRSDALRNHDRLVAAAREVIATHGTEARVEEIARRAGVGVGTVYRHFPDKESLIDAVLDDAFAEIVAVAEAALDEDDAWTGFVHYVERTATLYSANRGLRDVVAGNAHGRERAAAVRARLRPLVRRLVERAQAQGTLRPDLAPQDVPVLFWALDRVIDASSPVAPDIWRRLLALVLDGLRAGAATPLPHRALTTAQLDRIRERKTA